MNMMKDILIFIKVAFRNLMRHWRRSLGAILSIASGFAALNLFVGYIADAENVFQETYSKRLMYGDILVHRKDAYQEGIWDDGTRVMEPAVQQKVEEILSKTGKIDSFVRFLNMTGMVSNGSVSTVFVGYGYDVESGKLMREPNWGWNTLAGHPLSQPDTAVIGQGLGRILGCVPENKTPNISIHGGYPPIVNPFHCLSPNLELSVTNLTGQMNAVNVQIEGLLDAVYREADARFIALPLEKAQTLLDTKGISFYSLKLKDLSEKNEIVEQLQNSFKEFGLELKAVPWREHPYGDIYAHSMSFLNVFRNFTLAVTLAIVTLSVLSMFTRLVQERKQEIGTLRSIGFRPKQVFHLFLIEAILIAIMGDIVGLGVTLGATVSLNSAGILYKIGILSEKVPFHITLPLSNIAISALILTLLGCFAAWAAIRKTLKAKIPDCLSKT